ncbi:hypothetical protein pb186bvf_016686 [Paramecium bursaria]
MLKHILLITLLTFTLAKRHAPPGPPPPPEDEPPFPEPPGEDGEAPPPPPPGQDDPFFACLKEHCVEQVKACIDDQDCFPTIQNCGDQFKDDPDGEERDNAFHGCLQPEKAANELGICVAENCDPRHPHPDTFLAKRAMKTLKLMTLGAQ